MWQTILPSGWDQGHGQGIKLDLPINSINHIFLPGVSITGNRQQVFIPHMVSLWIKTIIIMLNGCDVRLVFDWITSPTNNWIMIIYNHGHGPWSWFYHLHDYTIGRNWNQNWNSQNSELDSELDLNWNHDDSNPIDPISNHRCHRHRRHHIIYAKSSWE